MSWIVSSGEFLKSTQLEIGEYLHPGCELSLRVEINPEIRFTAKL